MFPTWLKFVGQIWYEVSPCQLFPVCCQEQASSLLSVFIINYPLWSAGVFFHRTNHVQFSFFESTKRDLLDSSRPEYAKSGRYSPAPFHAISPRYSPYYEIQKDFKDISVPELLATVNLINSAPTSAAEKIHGCLVDPVFQKREACFIHQDRSKIIDLP